MEITAGIVMFWFVCAIAGAIIGKAKQSEGAGFMLGLILGPIGVLAAFALDGRPQCRQCRGRHNPQALVCQHCGYRLSGVSDPRYPQK